MASPLPDEFPNEAAGAETGCSGPSILDITANFIRSVAYKAVDETVAAAAAEASYHSGHSSAGRGAGVSTAVRSRQAPVVVVGLNGIQGSGKTTLAENLKSVLLPNSQAPQAPSDPQACPSVPNTGTNLSSSHVRRPSTFANNRIIRSFTVLPLDDFYLPHEKLVRFSKATGRNLDCCTGDASASLPSEDGKLRTQEGETQESNKREQGGTPNPLLQCRGQPGTHDLPLLLDVLGQLKGLETAGPETNSTGPSVRTIRIPRYDKSANAGLGDRVPEREWRELVFEIDPGASTSFDYRIGKGTGSGLGTRPTDDSTLPGQSHAQVQPQDALQTPSLLSSISNQSSAPPDDHLLPPQSVPPKEPGVHVVLLEGWCLGFAALGTAGVRERWKKIVERYQRPNRPHRDLDDNGAGDDVEEGGKQAISTERRTRWLENTKVEHMCEIDHYLDKNGYMEINRMLDAFIHLDAQDTDYVYAWRLEQEFGLRAANGGRGMSDEEVLDFVDRYYPSYEMYLPRLRNGELYPLKDRERGGNGIGEYSCSGGGDTVAAASASTAGTDESQSRLQFQTTHNRSLRALPRLYFILGRGREMLLTRTDEVLAERKDRREPDGR